jgi:peptide/nickel transport system permease protein
LGTTGNGQDILSQLIWSTRQSLLLAIVAGVMATIVSVLIGVSAAYLGGVWDHVLNLFTDVFLVIPTLPLMIVVAAYAKSGGIVVLIAVIVITGWSYGARQLRSQALSLRNREFLEAARSRGERSPYIIVFEVLPPMTSLIVANFLGAALYSVLAAAGLQFIGLGDPNDLSWGTMLYWAQNNGALLAGSPLWALAPGICIALLGGAFALINYAFDEISNPALRPVRRRRRGRLMPLTGPPPEGGGQY